MDRRAAAVIMAAGKSTRMKSALPKAAHPICGKPMTRHVIDACRQSGISEVIVVVGHEADKVKSALGEDVLYASQTQQLGTGHACRQALPHVPESTDVVLVLPGDAPLITAAAITRLLDTHASENNAATLLTAEMDDPAQYGRVVRGPGGSVIRIVEARDADEKTLAINEINTSIYCFDRGVLERDLAKLTTDNAQGEYYLTDVIELIRESGGRVGAVVAEDAADTMGINNRMELARANSIMRLRILNELMLSGVTIADPLTTYVDCDVEIGRDTLIQPFTYIEKGTRVGANCVIGPFARLSGVSIPDGTTGVVSNG